MVISMVIHPNVRYQSEGIKVVFKIKSYIAEISRAVAMVTTFTFTK
jgi:hypothetical protein